METWRALARGHPLRAVDARRMIERLRIARDARRCRPNYVPAAGKPGQDPPLRER